FSDYADRTSFSSRCIRRNLRILRERYNSLKKNPTKLLTGPKDERTMRRWSEVEHSGHKVFNRCAEKKIDGGLSLLHSKRIQCCAATTRRESIRRAGSKCRPSFAVTSKRSTVRHCILPV